MLSKRVAVRMAEARAALFGPSRLEQENERLQQENALLREAAEWAMVAGGCEAAYQLGRWDERFGRKDERGDSVLARTARERQSGA